MACHCLVFQHVCSGLILKLCEMIPQYVTHQASPEFSRSCWTTWSWSMHEGFDVRTGGLLVWGCKQHLEQT